MPFVHSWMRHFLLGLGAVLLVGFSWFAWFAWVSPQARASNRSRQASQLVQPGMRPRQTLAIMGPPASKRTNEHGLFYLYPKHSFASDSVAFWVGADSVVAGISHGG